MTGLSTAPLQVVLVGKHTFGLPNGMAATSRVKLYCRALASTGDSVRVLIASVSERPPHVINTEPRGVVDGIPFEYTTGSPVRGKTFLSRRFAEVHGTAVAIARLASMRRSTPRVVMIAYVETTRCRPGYLLLAASARALGIPVVLDLCEVPWSLRSDRRPWERLLSPLALSSGAITISSYLTRWANAEYARQHRNAVATEIPVLVDADEIVPSPYPSSAQQAIYAAPSGYDDSLDFVLRAMRQVWASEPECRLVVTGMAFSKLEGHLRKLAFSPAESAKVVATGWLDRDSLWQLYSESSVTLAPLFDDQRSIARFPTKIGEYAAAARPVVTSSVGEVRRYLEDGINAFIAEPGDVASFGGKILEVLSDPELAAAVGARARQLAEDLFDYRVHAGRLHDSMAFPLNEGDSCVA